METYAGMCFDEPEQGDVEVKMETLETAMGLKYKGPMVYEFDFVDVDSTHEKLVLLPVCPLVDLPMMRPDLMHKLPAVLRVKAQAAHDTGRQLVAA